jgi:hypothetical protein
MNFCAAQDRKNKRTDTHGTLIERLRIFHGSWVKAEAARENGVYPTQLTP